MAVGHVGEQVVEVHLERPHLVVVPLVADGEHENVVAGLQLPLPALKEGLGSSRAHLAAPHAVLGCAGCTAGAAKPRPARAPGKRPRRPARTRVR